MDLLSNVKKYLWLLPVVGGGIGFFTSQDNKGMYGAIAGVGLAGFLLSGEATDDQVFSDVPVLPGINEGLVQSVLADLSSTLLTTLFDASPRCDALQRYYGIQENEFKVIANRFKNLNRITIRNAINNLYTDGCGLFQEEWSDKVVQRLNQLSIP